MDSETNKQDNSNNKEDDAAAKKRRSKNDPEGRSYKCEVCGKSYLSKPAVTQHLKTKHPDMLNGIKRGRGRPKKDDGQEAQINTRETFMKTFFDKSSRLKGVDIYDVKQELLHCFKTLYTDYKDVLFKDSAELDLEYPLLTLQSSEFDSEGAKTYDQAIVQYLEYVGSKSSKSFFLFACKFSILFREFINKSKLKLEDVKHPFSVHNSAESVPESCNDFIVDFLEENSFFNLDMNELIEEIQHFCTWLYENGHTMSMLTLVNS